ncbi:MAG: monovalent cation/H+ antiporter subunit D family protein [Desulfohalobiaceae bacterium]|nr:monovalent cation/H+ antiporter subunit D family protein [Desulfohalobiaceae bacterium]
MDQLISIRPLLAVLVSLCVVPVLLSASNRPNVREGWTFLAGIVKFLLVVSMLPAVLQGKELACTLVQIAPGAALSFRVDGLGLLFALVASFLWLVTSLYSIGYMRGLKEHGQTRYFSFFALALSATIGVAFSANLLTLYLFYEILSLATYPLVTHHQDREARISGRKYLVFILGTSIGLVLPAMLFCYHLTGTLEFSTQGIFSGQLSKPALTVLLLMFVFGFAKAGMMPFHSWLPAAMVAPTPVSALLHAVAVVKVGVFSIVRVLTGIFGLELLSLHDLGTIVAGLASITIVGGSLIALSQDELKRRLAFSTISQLSYIVLGVALLTPAGVLGGVIHIAMHAFGKITLFFCAGAIFVASGKKSISQMDGLGKRMPLTFAAFFVGALGVIGLPPSGGFFSKWFLVLGSIDSGQTFFLFVLLLSSFLNGFYFLPIVYRGFFAGSRQGGQDSPGIREAPLCCLVPLLITAILSMALFFYPDIFVQLIKIGLQLP